MLADHDDSSHRVNIGDTERWVSLLGGSLLALYGITRHSKTGLAMALLGGAVALRAVKGHSGTYQRLGMRSFSGAGGERNSIRGPAVRVERSITVDRPVEEVYRFWRDLENLPRFMEHLIDVRMLPSGFYRWVAKAPMGTVEWDAEILEDQVPWLISWRSVEGSAIDNAGSVRFSQSAGGQGTEVRVELAYKPPAGAMGALVARLLGEEPSVQVRDDLERFKEIVESGETAVISSWTASYGKARDHLGSASE